MTSFNRHQWIPWFTGVGVFTALCGTSLAQDLTVGGTVLELPSPSIESEWERMLIDACPACILPLNNPLAGNFFPPAPPVPPGAIASRPGYGPFVDCPASTAVVMHSGTIGVFNDSNQQWTFLIRQGNDSHTVSMQPGEIASFTVDGTRPVEFAGSAISAQNLEPGGLYRLSAQNSQWVVSRL